MGTQWILVPWHWPFCCAVGMCCLLMKIYKGVVHLYVLLGGPAHLYCTWKALLAASRYHLPYQQVSPQQWAMSVVCLLDTWYMIKCKATFSPQILSHIRWLEERELGTMLTWSVSSYSSTVFLKFTCLCTYTCNKRSIIVTFYHMMGRDTVWKFSL